MPATIEFNGKRYDALTGQILDDGADKISGPKPQSQPAEPAAVQPAASPAKDYVPSAQPEVSRRQIEISSGSDSTRPKELNNLHQTSTVTPAARQPEKSKTLMRSAVKKKTYRAGDEHQPAARIKLYQELENRRKFRSQDVARSTRIQKFHAASAAQTFDEAPLPADIKPQPIQVAEPPIQTIQPNLPSRVSPQEKFTEAIDSAQSHLQVYEGDKKDSKTARRLVYGGAGLVSVLLIGFAFFQALPLLKVKLASDKAGFSANLPDYSPDGYGLNGNLVAQSGEVRLSYSSRTNDKNYEITETPTQWNSGSLLNNFILSSGEQYETLDHNGKTIYLYDDEKSATWLDSGVWYRLEGNADLSNDQLLKIVSGL